MRNNLCIGSGISGMGGIPMLGTGARGLTYLIREIFRNGGQGFAYDPNDLTEEKIKWRKNLFTETEFRNGLNDSINKAGALTPVAFAGLTAGTGIQLGTATGGTYMYKSATYKADTPYTFSCYVRMLDGTAPRFGSTYAGATADIDISLVLKGAAYQAEVRNLGGGLYRAYATTMVSSSTGSSFGVVKYQNSSSKPVIVSGFQLEEGPQLTEYQALTDFNTEFLRQFPLHALYQDITGTIPVTAADQPVGLMKDKSGRNNHAFQAISASRPILQRNDTTGAYYLAFDGVDDFLQTNNIDFSATDKVSLFAGVRKLSDTAAGAVVELSENTTSNNGSFGLFAPNLAAQQDVTSFLKGNGGRDVLASGNYSAPISVLVTAKFDISGNNKQYLKVNGAVHTTTNSVGTGSFGNYPLYISRRSGTSYPFSGHFYSLIGIGRLTTDSETAALEKAIAKNTGVTLNV